MKSIGICGATYTRPETREGLGAEVACTFQVKHHTYHSWQWLADEEDRRREIIDNLSIPDVEVVVRDLDRVALWCRLCDDEIAVRGDGPMTPQRLARATDYHRHRHGLDREDVEASNLVAQVEALGRLLQPAIVEVAQQRWNYSQDKAKSATFHALHNAQSGLAQLMRLAISLTSKED
jgi:hypothetical protein